MQIVYLDADSQTWFMYNYRGHPQTPVLALKTAPAGK